MNILTNLRDIFLPHSRNEYKPHILSRKSLSLFAAIMLAVKILAVLSLGYASQSQAQNSELSSASILELTNYSRNVFSLPPLMINEQLNKAAQNKAQSMFSSQYFSHVSPDGLQAWDFIKAQGYNYIIAGENLAINFASAEGAERAWMNSPNHKANILNKDFRDIGIGIASGVFKGVNSTIVVQMFGSSLDQPFVPLADFSKPKSANNSGSESPLIPLPKNISLSTPILDSPKYALTNKKNYPISGIAPAANSVYVLVNHQPQQKLEVIQGHFSGNIALKEGVNIVNVLSFNNLLEASNVSNAITVELDTLAPSVGNVSIKPITENSQTFYLVEVQTQSEAAKLLANLNDQNILLQPSSEQNVWQGRFALDPAFAATGRLVVNAYDLAGNSMPTVAANFTDSLAESVGAANSAVQDNSIFGSNFSYDQLNSVYIYFALFLLGCLFIAIAFKRHVQHINLIAPTSAMIMIAMVFYVT